MSMRRWIPFVSALSIAAAVAAEPTLAADLDIGVRADTTTMDPHFHRVITNTAYHRHVFEALVGRDPQLRLQPELATRWAPVNSTTWEFELRSNVRFHDGTPFTAEDVAFSLRRVPTVPNSPGPFTQYVRAIVGIEIVDPHRIRLTTSGPYPQLPSDLNLIQIVSATAAARAQTADFNSGTAAIGTGPFRLQRWSPGDRLRLSRFDGYWGDRPAWQNVTFRIIPNDGARLSALLGGDVDVIDAVPVTDVARLENDSRVRLVRSPSTLVMYLVPDHFRTESPYVTDRSGKPIAPNPLRDLRVRQALSLALNRGSITTRLMDGLAVPSNQLVPEGMFGFSPSIPPAAFDPARARQLLAEAGLPDGFRLVMHCPNDRYINDQKVCEAVAQMLARIGVEIALTAEPRNVFFTRVGRNDDSFILIGWANEGADSLVGLRGVLHSPDRELGLGGFNRGRYSNPAVDRLIQEASTTLDNSRRAALQQRAMEAAMADVAVIPLYANTLVWATRRGFVFTPSPDEGTLAMRVAPQP